MVSRWNDDEMEGTTVRGTISGLDSKSVEPKGGLFMEPPVSEAEYMAMTPEQRMEYDDARVQQLAELRVPKVQPWEQVQAHVPEAGER